MDQFIAGLYELRNFPNGPIQSAVLMREVSKGRESESPPPPPPDSPAGSPPASWSTAINHEQDTTSTFVKAESPITPSMQVDNPMNSFTTTQTSYVINQPTDSTPIAPATAPSVPHPQPLDYPSNRRTEFISVPSERQKWAIISMRQKGYSLVDIQHGFRNHSNIQFSIETIETVVNQSQTTNQSPMEQENPTTIDAAQKETTATQPQITNGLHLENPSNSTSSKIETRPDNTQRTRTEPPSTPEPPNPQTQRESSPPAPPPILLNSLQNLPAEEALQQLEAIQASLPALLERQRRLVQEIEEEKRERQRKEEELAAEIAKQEKELEETITVIRIHEMAIKEKNKQLTMLRDRSARLKGQQQLEKAVRYFPL